MLSENSLVLAIDGSGIASYKHPSKEYCVSGVITTRKYLNKLNHKISRVSKKYFGDENIIFHFTEISRKIGVFDSLKDPSYEIKFWSEIINFINQKHLFLVYVIIDKMKAKHLGWQQTTLAQRAYESVVRVFLQKAKKTKLTGQIITESDPYTDNALIKVHNKFQAQGIKKIKISGKIYHRTITSLSLVNKHNLDSTVQIADLLGFSARLRYRRLSMLDTSNSITELQKKLLKLIERKINKHEAKFIVI